MCRMISSLEGVLLKLRKLHRVDGGGGDGRVCRKVDDRLIHRAVGLYPTDGDPLHTIPYT